MKRLAAGAVLFAALAGPALAAPALDATDWTVDVGLVGRTRPAHLGAPRQIVDAVPVFEAEAGNLRLSFDDGAKWSAWRAGAFSAGPIVEYRQAFNDDLPPGAAHAGGAIEAGGFAAARTPIGVVEARVRRAVDGYGGWSGDLSFDTGGEVAPKTLLGAQLRLSWADAKFTNAYFGLPPGQAPMGAPPRFLIGDYTTAGAQVAGARDLGAHSRLILIVSDDEMLGDLRPSALFRRRDIYTAALGLTYHWVSTTPGSAR